MKKSSGSVSFRASRKSSGKKNASGHKHTGGTPDSFSADTTDRFPGKSSSSAYSDASSAERISAGADYGGGMSGSKANDQENFFYDRPDKQTVFRRIAEANNEARSGSKDYSAGSTDLYNGHDYAGAHKQSFAAGSGDSFISNGNHKNNEYQDASFRNAGRKGNSLSVNKDTKKKEKRKNSKPKGCLKPILILIFFIAAVYALIYAAFSKVDKHKLDKSAITMNSEDMNMKKYQTIALFGVDDQNNEIKDTGSRTDSIIVACINKTTKSVKLMSIYRDTYVSIDGKYDKINAAYSYGGPEQAINTINRNLDLNITDFATVNFKALADAVDILGGIRLTIKTEKELKNLNDYIGNMNKINGGESPRFDDVGTYTFDGNQAVAYSRIRYMEGGDHARASHQRLVVEGILHEAKKQPWKLNALISKVLPQCKTSFSTGEFSRMALGLILYDIKDSQAYPFDSFDERYNGVYYGFPTTVESNVIQAHEYLFGTKDYEPTDELKRISGKVEDVADMVSPY